MNIVTISWVRNEADIIESFVRHHCAFVDRMIIIDNRSRDDTASVLNKLKDERLRLDVRRDDSFIHRQGDALTALLKELGETDVDVVLPLDADEFLWTQYRNGPRAALENLFMDAPTLLPWKTYVPLPEDPQSERNPLKRITHRRAAEHPQWYKVVIPGALLRQNVMMNLGSHELLDATTKKSTEHHFANELFLAHFPVRSADQIAAKVCGGWLSHLSNPKRVPGTIFQWQAIYEEMKVGKTLDAHRLKTLALEYATHAQWNTLSEEMKGACTLASCTNDRRPPESLLDAVVYDPIPARETMYPGQRITAMQVLLESAEHLAEETAQMQRIADSL